MPLAPVATNVNEPLDILPNNTPEITLDNELPLDHLTEAIHFVFGESTHLAVGCNLANSQSPFRNRSTHSVYVCQRNLNMLLAGNINPGNACHLNKPFGSSGTQRGDAPSSRETYKRATLRSSLLLLVLGF